MWMTRSHASRPAALAAGLALVLLSLCASSSLVAAEETATASESAPGALDASPGSSKPVTYYSLLDVELDASASDIKKKYRKLALMHHPDKAPDETEKARRHEFFVKLSQAYQVRWFAGLLLRLCWRASPVGADVGHSPSLLLPSSRVPPSPQILSDDVMRARYDFLLSQGKFEYENRNWEEFDRKRGVDRKVFVRTRADGTEEFVFKDAYQQYMDAAEDRALILSFGIAFLVALVPWALFRYRRYQAEAPKTDPEARREEVRVANKVRARGGSRHLP